MDKSDLKVLNVIETPIIIFDKEYNIVEHNKSAKKLIAPDFSMLQIINSVYWPIFMNGIKNKFPFSISEKGLLNKTVLVTSTDSYKLIVKPMADKFVAECIKLGSSKKTNTILLKKNREFIKQSTILSELIGIKSGRKDIDRMSSDDIITVYEEQLKLQFSIDDAVTKTIEPIVAGDLSIEEAANIVLSEIKVIMNCQIGAIVVKEDDRFHKIDEFDTNEVEIKIENQDDLFGHFFEFNRPFYCDSMSSFGYDIKYENKNKLTAIMVLPLIIEGLNVGFMFLAHTKGTFTEMHFNISKRLCQLFALAFQRSNYLKHLQQQANSDILTGCYNRRAGLAYLDSIYLESNANESPFSLVFYDINNLKTTNDTLGHDCGDELIQSFAKIVIEVIRHSDIFSRYGGDEFILILPDCNAKSAEGLIKRIQNKINYFNENENKKFTLSVSHGLVEHTPETGNKPKDLIRMADELMFDNKRGKNK